MAQSNQDDRAAWSIRLIEDAHMRPASGPPVMRLFIADLPIGDIDVMAESFGPGRCG
jgi:hypothetical protein